MSRALFAVVLILVLLMTMSFFSGVRQGSAPPPGDSAKQFAAVCNGVLVFTLGGCNVSLAETTDSNNTTDNGKESPTEMVLSAVIGILLIGFMLLVFKPRNGSRGTDE